ncbi:MAG: LacI family DNA-binding transcriptional regulator [Anaerolineae bacterium]|nr:LacI family DNA-binding transcriptional regulator [Anaerolineae bacterium]
MVSYVLNGNTPVPVSEQARRRIQDAIEQLGYQPNRAARSLRTSKTYTIAAIIPDILNPFYPAFVRGIQDVADENGYDVITFNTDGLATKERKCIRSMLETRVDGLVAVLFHTSARDLFPLLDHNIPVVRLEATEKAGGARPLDNIYLDNVAGARVAVRLLIEKGHRRIGLLAGHEGPSGARLVGYQDALESYSIPVLPELMQRCDFNEEGGYSAMRLLLDLDPPPTAVFASNDLMAMGAYLAIKEAGRRIPDDVAVVGFDNIPTSKLVSPPLTTVDQFQHQVGQRAARMLLERIQERSPASGRSEQQPFQLIIRASA